MQRCAANAEQPLVHPLEGVFRQIYVGETTDSRVNNMWSDPVQREHVFDALA